MKDWQLRLDLLKTLKGAVTPILTRLRQPPDLWHLVTGLGSDVNGELSVQAFCLVQIRIPLPILRAAFVSVLLIANQLRLARS